MMPCLKWTLPSLKTTTFTQRVKLLAENYAVKGYLNYSACNDQNCLPPTNVEFDLKGTDGPKAAAPAQEKKEAKAAALLIIANLRSQEH